MVRLFVALDIPDDIREQYAVALDTIRGSRARCSFVDPSQMHITLKFIGEIEGSRLSAFCDALAGITCTPFTLSLGAITIDNQKRPRVVWGDVDDPGECRTLAGEIDSVLSSLGVEREKRRFKPHITIARVKQFHPSLFDAVAAVSGSCSGSFDADRFVLKKSDLTPGGPRYTDILEVPL